jgi:HSP20 family protein
MAIIRWNPWRDYDLLQREMNRVLEDWSGRSGEKAKDLCTTDWVPNVDIYEDKEAIVVTAELPGMTEKEVKVQVEERVLTLSGEKKFENEKKRDSYHRIESYYGCFSRSFTLPPNVDRDKIAARMDNGVLHVVLPKKEEARPKAVEIKVGK